MPYHRILIPVDGSPPSNKALVAALETARESGARVRVMHAIDEFALAVGPEYAGNVMKAAREEAQKMLDGALKSVKSSGIEGDAHLVEAPGSRLGDAVAAEAEAWGADLVVVGTHGRRGIGRALLGSGAESVIRLSKLPVLVVRSDEKS